MINSIDLLINRIEYKIKRYLDIQYPTIEDTEQFKKNYLSYREAVITRNKYTDIKLKNYIY